MTYNKRGGKHLRIVLTAWRPFVRFRTVFVLLFLGAFLLVFHSGKSRSSYVVSQPPSSPHFVDYLASTPSTSLPVIPLVSQRDFWGFYETMSFQEFKAFNPSLLSLPFKRDGYATFAVVAREENKWVMQSGTEVQPRNIIAALVDGPNSTTGYSTRWFPKEYPRIESHSTERLDKLVHSTDTFFPKCESMPWYTNNQGPEDGRLSWTHLGEPLLIYISISPTHSDLCRILYLVDLRSVYQPLENLLAETIQSTPIRFPHSVPLLYQNQTGFNKNWAVFTNRAGEIFIHTDLVPQRIYRLRLPDPPNSLPTFSSPLSDLSLLEPIATHSSHNENCVSIVLGGIGTKGRPYEPWLHQSTPFLDTVLCTSADVHSGLCDTKDPANHIYIGLIHGLHRERDLYYERRILTLNYSSPFNYISISKPLMYCACPIALFPKRHLLTCGFHSRRRPTISSVYCLPGFQKSPTDEIR